MGRDFGPQTISRGGTGSSSDISEAISQVINGRLECTPAYYQTDDDDAVQISVSNNTRLAVAIVPPVDMELSSISRYITAVVEEPNYGTDIYLYDNGSAKEPNGDLNGSDTKAHSDQTDSSTPLTVAATSNDGGGANDEWKAFDGDDTTYWKSGADPATTAQDLEIDFGVGNEKIINKVIIRAANEASEDDRCFPKTFTIQGHNGTSYSTLKTIASSTDPDDQGEQHYTWTSAVALQKVKINITDNHGAGAFVCVGEIEFIEAQDEDAPGTLLETIPISPTVGDTADVWQTDAIDEGYEPQLQAGKKYWIVERL